MSSCRRSISRAATQRERIDTDLLLQLASPLRQRLVQLAIMQVAPLSPFSFLLPRFFRSTAFSISPSWWRRGSTSGDSFIVSIPFLLLITSFGSKTGSLIDSFFASLLLVWERRAQVQNLGKDKRKYVEPLNWKPVSF